MFFFLFFLCWRLHFDCFVTGVRSILMVPEAESRYPVAAERKKKKRKIDCRKLQLYLVQDRKASDRLHEAKK